jgi:hypothetical protein
MGIADRDYYRENVRRMSRTRTSTWKIVLVWAAVLGALYFVASHVHWGGGVRTTNGVASVGAPSPPAPAAVAESIAPRASPTAPVDPRIDNGPSPIYRCGSSYGQTACAGGSVVAAPAASGFDSRPSARLAEMVAAGRTPDSATGTTVYRTAVVENGVATADRAAQCRALSAEIEAIDRAARRPQTRYEQDRLRAQRQAARDRQVQLHC